MFIKHNANPIKNIVGDCVIRAIAVAMNEDYEIVYIGLMIQGLGMYDLPSANEVWGTYLLTKGFSRFNIPNTCPLCYTIKDFCRDYPSGSYVLGTGTHAVAVVDGNYYDTWDSGDEVPMYAFRKER